jgi:peptidoglycan-associated lipoprotein
MAHFVRPVFLVVVMLLVGCGRKEAPPPAAVTPAPAARPDNDGGREAAERAAREAAEAAATARREADRVRAVLEERVFFDYDESNIREDTRRTLDEKVRALRDNPAVRLRIEGHADERGSTEYNLALGSRRAQSVLNYITGFGIAPGRLETVTYGEERPLVSASNDRAWAQNRRAEFIITAGAPGATEASVR